MPRAPGSAPLPSPIGIPDADPGSGRWSAVLLVVLIVGTFAPALRGEFVWDDIDHVVQNERVTAPDGLIRSWTETGSPGFYPVTYATFFAEWRLGGGQPWLFHLDNILLHAGNALLAVRLAQVLALPSMACWFVAALWALHPVQVASVAWIAERKNLLYVFLYLSSLLLHAASTEASAGSRARAAQYVASVAVFPLALFSKAAALTLPAAIALVQWARRRPLDRRFWLTLVPYALVGFAGGIALLSSVPAEMRMPSFLLRLVRAPRALWFYVGTFVWPRGLLTMYPRWPLDPTGIGDLAPWIGLLATAGVCLAVRNRLPRTVGFGLGFFLVNVALVIGLIWFTYLDHAPVADHLAYLPNLGLAFVAVGGAMELARRTHVPERGVAVVLGLWCTLLAVACSRQIGVWHDTETFWTSALAGNSECSICHYNLGKLFDERGERDLAASHYEATLRLDPDPEAAINLGNIRVAGGQLEEAMALYRRAIQLDATNPAAHRNLGVALVMRGRADEGIAEYRAAFRLAPDDADTADLLSKALVAAGRTGEAVTLLEKLLERLPDADVAASLAWIRATSSDPSWRDGTAAVRLAERACELTGYEDADKLDTLAAAYAEAGRFPDAVQTARRALAAAEPQSPLADEVRERLALYEAQKPFRSQ